LETTPGSSRKYIATDMYRERFPKQISKGSVSKRTNEQMGLHQTKELLDNKEKVTRLKRQPTEWKNTFPRYSSNKGQIFRVYRELKKFSPRRINTPMKNWAHELSREFSKEEEQMASKYMKKFSTSLALKRCKSKQHLDFISPQLKWP
jgi:hypothetical protein